MTDPTIVVSGLTKYYGDVRGVEDLSFAVRPGEVFGFLGPNGSGKTTTIRVLLGLTSPTAGSATLLDTDVTDRDALREARRDLGHVPGDVSFYERTTGERVLDYFGRLKGERRREELLERFPVHLDRRVKTYSRGNRQKLAIVQAFMHEPTVVVMDEPTSGLDPLVQNEFYDLLAEERDRGATVFFSSHILSEVRRVCDRVAVIREGKLVALENIHDLLEKSGKVVRVRLAESPDPDAFRFDGVARATVDADGVLELVVTGNYEGLVSHLDGREIEDIEIRETSLEDVFIHFYGGGDVEDTTDGGGTETGDERGTNTGDEPDVDVSRASGAGGGDEGTGGGGDA